MIPKCLAEFGEAEMFGPRSPITCWSSHEFAVKEAKRGRRPFLWVGRQTSDIGQAALIALCKGQVNPRYNLPPSLFGSNWYDFVWGIS